MMSVQWGSGIVPLFPYGGSQLGPPPDDLKHVEASGQNTLSLEDGEPVLVRAPDSRGGPNAWTWQLLNIGPGVCFARWDGLGYAKEDDEHSLRIPAGIGFSGIRAGLLTFACEGQTHVTFTAENLPRSE